MVDVTMPQLGETVTEGTITRWMKAIGEPVSRDEPLFEVSTDKVDSEVPAPATGTLSEILVGEGETVLVGARLAVITDGAAGQPPAAPPQAEAPPTAPPPAPAPPPTPPAAPAPAQSPAPPPVAQTPPPPPAPAPVQPTPAAPQALPPPPAPAPVQPTPAAPQAPPPPLAPAPVQPTPAAPQPPPTLPRQPTPPAAGVVPPPPPAGYTARPLVVPVATTGPAAESRVLSPVVRRLMVEHGLEPADVVGTGLGGRITREDVLAVIDARHTAAPAAEPQPQPQPQPAESPAPPPAPAPPPPAPAAEAPAPPPPPPPVPVATGGAPSGPSAELYSIRPTAGDRVVPFTNIRRRTAEHMVRSKSTSPHAFIAYEVDFENVERVRRSFGERFKAEEGFSLTYLPFVARATVDALRDFPNLNASVGEDSLIVHQQVNLGIAVDLDYEGLIVPVVHRAEEVTLRGVARRIRDLADRARTRQLTADDITGGTFSITNDGPFGTHFTVPIINQPQVAILATDGIARRPVVVALPDGSESIAIHSMGVLGMSWDHRAVDGAYVSSFLRRLAEVLGTRDWASEL